MVWEWDWSSCLKLVQHWVRMTLIVNSEMDTTYKIILNLKFLSWPDICWNDFCPNTLHNHAWVKMWSLSLEIEILVSLVNSQWAGGEETFPVLYKQSTQYYTTKCQSWRKRDRYIHVCTLYNWRGTELILYIVCISSHAHVHVACTLCTSYNMTFSGMSACCCESSCIVVQELSDVM